MTKHKENAIENFKKSLEVSKQLKQEAENIPDSQPDSGLKSAIINGANKEIILTEWIISALTAVKTESDLKDAVISAWLFDALNDLCNITKDYMVKFNKIKGVLKTKDYDNVELAAKELSQALDILREEEYKSITNNENKITLDNELKEFISNEINSGLMVLHNEMCTKISTLRIDIEDRIDNAVFHLENIINKGFDNINSK